MSALSSEQTPLLLGTEASRCQSSTTRPAKADGAERAGPAARLSHDAVRHHLVVAIQCSPPRPAGDGATIPSPEAPRRRSPVVLSLEELELLLDAIQRLRYGEFERLSCSLVRGLRRRPAREREARSDTVQPPRREGVCGAIHRGRARDGGKGGKDGDPSPPHPTPPWDPAHSLPTFPSLICEGERLTAQREPLRSLPARFCYRRLHESGACRLLPVDPRRGGTAREPLSAGRGIMPVPAANPCRHSQGG